jgi:hypothetical protein
MVRRSYSSLFSLLSSSHPSQFYRYIRNKGAYYKESLVRTLVGSVLPFHILILVFAPPTVLFYFSARNFNTAFRSGTQVLDMLVDWQATWEGPPIKLIKLAQLTPPTTILSTSLTQSSNQSQVGSAYCGAVLVIVSVVSPHYFHPYLLLSSFRPLFIFFPPELIFFLP